LRLGGLEGRSVSCRSLRGGILHHGSAERLGTSGSSRGPCSVRFGEAALYLMRWLSIAGIAVAACAHAQLDGSLISLEHAAIGYRSQPLQNSVADLQERLAQGKTELAFDAR